MRPGGEDGLRSTGAAVVNASDDHAEGLKCHSRLLRLASRQKSPSLRVCCCQQTQRVVVLLQLNVKKSCKYTQTQRKRVRE